MDATKRLCKLLDELGVEYVSIGGVTNWEHAEFDELADGSDTRLIVHGATPEQAIAATVGDNAKDNPRNYNPDGTPKIPNMNVGADPDWVDWVASLEHKEPLDLTEAVKQFMFEVICFGGEMGPNDCGGEYCPDEGMVYTNDFINGWVNKIAASVGKDIEHYDGSGRRGTVAILQGGRKPEEVLFVREEGGVTHYLPEGAGTCEPWDMRSNHAVQAANEQKVDERNTVPETKYLMALDEAREAQRKLEMCQTSQKVYQSKCRSLKETNADLRRIIDDMKVATVGAGTCKDLGGIGADGEAVFHCSECGCVMSLFDKDGKNNLCTNFIYDYPRFCPECGKRIKED